MGDDLNDILNDAFESAGVRLHPSWRTKKPRTAGWFKRVSVLLRQGYGVEDIAIKQRCEPDEVRAHVQFLRRTGELRKMFGARPAPVPERHDPPKKGTRVKLSPKAIASKIRTLADPKGERMGTVVSTPCAKSTRVLWDGLRTAETIHPMFLRVVAQDD